MWLKPYDPQKAAKQVIAHYRYSTQKPYLKVGLFHMSAYSQDAIHMKYTSDSQSLICMQIAKDSC